MKNISLQWVRACAAIAVALYHLYPLHPLGQQLGPVFAWMGAGVDLFFVLSGFLMAMLIRSQSSPAQFVFKRFVRIVPVYWLLTCALFVLDRLIPGLFHAQTPTFAKLFMSLCFIPYFDLDIDAAQPLMGQGWTLNYEVFFYVLCAASLIVKDARWRFSAVRLAFAALFAATLLTSDARAIVSFWGKPIVVEFLIGITVYQLHASTKRAQIPGYVIGAAIAAALAVMAGFGAPGLPDFYRLLVSGLPAAVIIYFCLYIQPSNGWTSRLLALLGDASYSIYLCHIFAYSLSLILFRTWLRDPSWFAYAGFALMSLVLMLVFSLAFYFFVEKPIIAVAHACHARWAGWPRSSRVKPGMSRF